LNVKVNYLKNMKFIKKYINYSLLIVFLAFPFIASAATSTTIEIDNPIASDNLLDLIETIVNYLLWIAVVAAPLTIIIAALMFLTAGGNERKVGTAKKMLMWAVIGIALALLSKGIVSLLGDFLSSV